MRIIPHHQPMQHRCQLPTGAQREPSPGPPVHAGDRAHQLEVGLPEALDRDQPVVAERPQRLCGGKGIGSRGGRLRAAPGQGEGRGQGTSARRRGGMEGDGGPWQCGAMGARICGWLTSRVHEGQGGRRAGGLVRAWCGRGGGSDRAGSSSPGMTSRVCRRKLFESTKVIMMPLIFHLSTPRSSAPSSCRHHVRHGGLYGRMRALCAVRSPVRRCVDHRPLAGRRL